MSPAETARAIERSLARHANPERRAVLQGGYAVSRLRTLGVSVPDLRGVVRRFAQQLRPVPARAVLATTRALVRGRVLEGRVAGYELLAGRPDAMALMTPSIAAELGRGNDNWAVVDAFATTVVGPAWRAGRIPDRAVLGWARGHDRWWRRTALASTVALNVRARGGTGDVRRTLAVCRCVAGDDDPMLAKALSWALRALVPHDPDAVRAFVSRKGRRVPALVRREVIARIETGRKSRR